MSTGDPFSTFKKLDISLFVLLMLIYLSENPIRESSRKLPLYFSQGEVFRSIQTRSLLQSSL